MNAPSQPDPDTAHSHEQDTDFAEEHTRPTFSGEQSGQANTTPDESTPPEHDSGGIPLADDNGGIV